MGVFSKILRVACVLSCVSLVLVDGRGGLGSKLQHELDLLQQQWQEIDTPLTAHISEAEIITPHHLAEEDASHTTISRRSAGKRSSTPFVQQPWPYTRHDPPCNTYARQDNCVGNPPINPGPLPACGAFSQTTPNTTVFAIIGDYGLDGNCESQVHGLVMKLQQQFGTLSFVMTTGDNAYWNGNCEALQSSVVQYYGSFLPNATIPCTDPMKNNKHGFVNPHWADTKHFDETKAKLSHELHQYKKRVAYEDLYADEPLNGDHHSSGVPLPRFFPTMGNHDWTTFSQDPLHMPYFQIFDYLMDFPPSDLAHGSFYMVTPIPGLELYSLNSNLGAPSATPIEQDLFQEMVNWLQKSLQASTARFKFVYFHHPPFCTAQHDALAPWMDLDYEDWGASAVFVGHEHVYERMLLNAARKDGSAPTMPYIVNGLGGHPWTYTIDGCPAYPGSQFRYNAFHGAQLVVQSWNEQTQKEQLDICFYSLENGGKLVDQFEIVAAN